MLIFSGTRMVELNSHLPFKEVAINPVYAFLSKNCRGPDVVLNVPHSSMLEVGLVYYVCQFSKCIT